jgi:hypothetical protein
MQFSKPELTKMITAVLEMKSALHLICIQIYT